MTPAVFTLKKYIFDKVSLNLENLSSGSTLSLNIEPWGSYNQETGEYLLSFLFEASQKDNNNSNAVVSIQCNASFCFQKPPKEEDFPQVFYANSIAILFPYIRAFVSTVTLQANLVPPIILPTMNLTSLGERLKSNTRFI